MGKQWSPLPPKKVTKFQKKSDFSQVIVHNGAQLTR